MTDAEGNEIGKLFVGGLSQATNNGSLRLYFSRFGEVDDAVVMMDNKTGRSRGFGYVKYREPESVTLALEAKPHILDGKEVDAKQCNVNMKGRNRRSLKVFVGGIGLDQDAESIKTFFRQFGRVTDVNLMMDSNKQRHRGFAFVGFEDETVVKRLINLHYVTMNSKQVEIKAMEPPNFGRKINSNANASVMHGNAAVENACAHAFEASGETSGFAGGLSALTGPVAYAAHGHPYLTAQNIFGQPRVSPHTAFDQQGNPFGSTLITDTLIQPPAFVHTLPPAQYRDSAEAVLAAGASPASFVSPKPPIPFILANGQLHQSTPTGLGTFNTNTCSLYAVPCQVLPQQLLSNPQAVGINNSDKNNYSGWAGSALHPAHLAICPPHVTPHASLLACSPYVTNQTTQIGSMAAVPQPNASAPILTPYYAVCSPYTTILQNEQLTPMQFTSPQQNSTVITPGRLQGPTSAAGDAPVLHLSSNSRTVSPTEEIKTEADSAAVNSLATKLVYPTVLMTTANGNQSNIVASTPSATISMNTTLWNQNASNVMYPSIPIGWSVPPTHTANTQWNLTSALTHPQLPIPSATAPGATGTGESITKHTGQEVQFNKEQEMERTHISAAKASGDSLDGLSCGSDRASQFPISDAFRSDSGFSKSKANEVGGKLEAQANNEATWPVNPRCQRACELVNWQNSVNCSSNVPRWTEIPPIAQIASSNNMVQTRPWALPLELMEETANFNGSLQNNVTPVHDSNYNITRPGNVVNQKTASTRPSATKSTTECMSRSESVTQSQRAQNQQVQTQQNQSITGQKQYTEQAHRANDSAQQIMRTVTRSTKMHNSLGDNVEVQSKVHTNVGTDLSSEGSTTRENNNRINYASWLYSAAGQLENRDRKDIQPPTNLNLELECQGPAGAAGDFHRPVPTGHYSSYH